ncbi:hypothetical protein ACR2XN_28220 [Klebsiella pneumoniae]
MPFLSATRAESVAPHLKSISTDSTLVAISQTPSSISSTDISHPLTSVSPSTDTLNSSHPLTTIITPSTDTSHPLITMEFTPDFENTQFSNLSNPISSGVDDSIVAKTLLGLREGSETVMSERLHCEQAKGEQMSERQAISSSLATCEGVSATLVGEGEGVRCVSHGEPLMQENRENERNAGT